MKNEQTEWIQVKQKNLQGIIETGLVAIVKAGFFQNPDRTLRAWGGRIVKDSRVRWAALVPVVGGETLFVKRFRMVDGPGRLKYLILTSRAKREWDISRFLTEKGILTPRALGMLEVKEHGLLRESFFIAEALEDARDLLDFSQDHFTTPDQREGKNQLLTLLAETTRRVHDSGLFHRDLHGGNILIRGADLPALYLVDLHQARKQSSVSRAKRLWNLAQIFNSLDFMLDHGGRTLFLCTYGQGRPPFGYDLETCMQRIQGIARRIARRRQKSRSKRCLKESTLFTVGKRSGFTVFRRREIEADVLMGVLEAHREKARSRGEGLVKYSPKTVVSLVNAVGTNGAPVCVKEYRYGTILGQLRNSFRKPKGKTAWIAGNLLFTYGICRLKPLAYVERRKLRLLRETFYVTESHAGDEEMDRYLIRRSHGEAGRELRRFISAFATWLGSLHRARIYHRDLKTCNILVREEHNGWGFSLVDLEDVRFGTRIGKDRILRNLVQVNCSIPRSVSYGDRVRFLKEYLNANPAALDQRRLIESVLEESRKRGIVYVSPEGVVLEKFE
jgi:serine/threonine protein kinase